MSKTKALSKILVLLIAIVLILPFTFQSKSFASERGRIKNVVKQTKMTTIEKKMMSGQIPDKLKPSVAGCVFGIYKDNSCKTLLDKVIIKDNNNGTYSGINEGGEVLPAGKVYIKELKAAKGYLLNSKVYEQTIQAGEQVEITIKNDLDIATPVVKKVADKKYVKPGDIVNYTLTVKNPSKTGTVYQYILQDELKVNNHEAHFLMDSIKISGVDNVSVKEAIEVDRGFILTPVTIAPEETMTVTYQVKIDKQIEGGIYENIAGEKVESKYKVDTSVLNGTITPNETTWYEKGETSKIESTSKKGYSFSKLIIDGKEYDKNSQDFPGSNVNISEEDEITTVKCDVPKISKNHVVRVEYEATVKPKLIKAFNVSMAKVGDTIKNTITYENTGIPESVAKDLVIEDHNQNGLEIDMDSIKVVSTGEVKTSIEKSDTSFTVKSPAVKGGESITITFNSTLKKDVEKITNEATATSDKTKKITSKAEATPSYTINTKVINGEISPNSELKRGESKKIEYSPHDGYELDKVIVDGKEVNKDEFSENYDFTNITKNHEIEVAYKGISTPTIEKTFNKKNFNVGETIKAKVIVRDTGKEGAVAHDLVISDKNMPGFKIKTDSIKAVATSGKPEVQVINEETSEFNVKLDKLSHKDTLTITYEMEITKENGEIENTATLITKEYPNGIPSTANGKLTIDISTSVTGGKITESKKDMGYGTDIPITYEPNDGYYLHTIEIDGKEVKQDGITDKYTFKNVQDNHSINVIYKKVPNPLLTKTSDKKNYTIGSIIKYTVSIKADADMEDAVLKDIFENDFEKYILLNKDSIKINGVKTPYAEEYHLGNIEPGKEVILTYEGKVISDKEKSIRNDASIISKGMNKEIKSSYSVNLKKTPKEKIDNQEIIKTGDKTNISIIIAIVLVLIISITIFSKKKK